MRSFLRLLLFCVLLLAGAPALRASIPKTRAGNFFALAAEPRPEIALQVPELRLDNPALYGESASGRLFWSKFDPEGLSEQEVAAIVNGAFNKFGAVGTAMRWIGLDKALTRSLNKADERMTANAADGNGRTLSTGQYVGGIAEGSAPAITIAAMAPAAAAGPLMLAKEGVAEATGIPIGFDDAAKLIKKADGLVETAKDVVQKAADKVEQMSPKSLVSRQGPSEMTGSKVKKLTKDMKKNGFDPAHPIEVAEVDGKKIILDGHHRAEAAARAGIKEVPVKTKPVTSEQADNLSREASEAAAERAARRR